MDAALDWIEGQKGRRRLQQGLPGRILAGGGRKVLSLRRRSSGSGAKRIALMCINAACQNDSFSSANLLKNNCPCATLKHIKQLNDKVNMFHAWRLGNLEAVLP